MPRFRDVAVSEVLGNSMLVAITVAMMAVVALITLDFAAPEDVVHADIKVVTNQTSIQLQHRGGEEVGLSTSVVFLLVDGSVVREPLSTYSAETLLEAGESVCITCSGLYNGQEITELRLVVADRFHLEWRGSVTPT